MTFFLKLTCLVLTMVGLLKVAWPLGGEPSIQSVLQGLALIILGVGWELVEILDRKCE